MKLELTVSSMVCEGCEETVKKVVKAKDSQADVVVDLASKKVTIETTAPENEIKEAIVAAGHTVD
ncbi:MAG: heavy-metal-associated domain-containing protein [Xenococcaceae cyanobacterium MO_207.B15]|nr:heavy-metal-associated domain-containing protein [Xenococcaceae cyanobacterium MO_207.B15]MDJ0742240.1 heavy-metal-associated domain-containing protein [Xenococcaceae cyanobacterium MO_167.B27]